MQQTMTGSFSRSDTHVLRASSVGQARSSSVVEKRFADCETFDMLSSYGAFSRAKELGVRSWHHDAHAEGLIADIRSIEELRENWDGEGASSVPRAAIQAAIAFIRVLMGTIVMPMAYANPNGTLTLYWSLPNGRAELEIGRTKFSWLTYSAALREPKIITGGGRTPDVLSIIGTPLISFIRTPPGRVDVSSIITLTMDHVWLEVA